MKPHTLTAPLFRIVQYSVCLGLLCASGCASNPTTVNDNTHSLSASAAQTHYNEAQKSLGNRNFTSAIESLELFQTRYPNHDLARDAQLDLAYAYFRDNDRDNAIAVINRFIRENPRHENVDYAYYLRGLVFFKPDIEGTKKLLGLDQAKRPPHNDQMSFNYFKQLVERFPNSEYSVDAQLKLQLLRNRLAQYELNIADYYMRRQAYVAASRRLENLIETYPQAPAVLPANRLLTQAYKELGLNDLAETSAIVSELNRDRFIQLGSDLEGASRDVKPDGWW